MRIENLFSALKEKSFGIEQSLMYLSRISKYFRLAMCLASFAIQIKPIIGLKPVFTQAGFCLLNAMIFH